MTLKAHEIPPPTYGFAYRDPPPSGNGINGLGETEWRRARELFHGSGARPLEWEALQSFFGMVVPLRLLLLWMSIRWYMRKANGPVARTKVDLGGPAAAATAVKDRALALGAHQVGIGPITENCLYDTYDTDLPTAIVVAVAHDPKDMETSPDVHSGIGTMKTYAKAGKASVDLAAWIRKRGWRAVAYGQSGEVLHIPLAINAGIGELGKHGSLISRELGASLRLAAVFTDMPLTHDAPVDVGVDDLCLTCRRCTTDCPADAISDAKQMVRGVERWYVDFDKCVPYFSKTYGCGLCLEVCPWSEPGRGPWLSDKLLAKRAKTKGGADANAAA
jgi:epoxyqueuosine reductase